MKKRWLKAAAAALSLALLLSGCMAAQVAVTFSESGSGSITTGSYFSKDFLEAMVEEGEEPDYSEYPLTKEIDGKTYVGSEETTSFADPEELDTLLNSGDSESSTYKSTVYTENGRTLLDFSCTIASDSEIANSEGDDTEEASALAEELFHLTLSLTFPHGVEKVTGCSADSYTIKENTAEISIVSAESAQTVHVIGILKDAPAPETALAATPEKVPENTPAETSGKTPAEAPEVLSAPAFSDVPAGSYYEAPVAWAVANGITNGTSATTFAPGNTCSRAQIITFLYRAAGEPAVSGSNPFADVPAGSYYEKATTWASENGMASGASFGANQPCTRAMAVEFMWKYAGSPVEKAADFEDIPSGAAYAPAVNWAVAKGVTKGTTESTFAPDNTCTRAQIVTFLYRGFAK